MSRFEQPRQEVAHADIDWDLVMTEEVKDHRDGINSMSYYSPNERHRRIMNILLDRENNGRLPDTHRRPTEPFGARFIYSAELDSGSSPQEALVRYELLCALPEGYVLWGKNCPASMLEHYDEQSGVVAWQEAEEFPEPFKPSDGNVHLIMPDPESFANES